MLCIEFLDNGQIMPALLPVSLPTVSIIINIHGLKTYTGEVQAEDSRIAPCGLSWAVYWSGIEKTRKERVFSKQMFFGSSME